MQIKSFGCSFIFGSELADDGRHKSYATGSQLTWPALLAKHYNYQYATYARPGSGNLQILERLMSNLAGEVNEKILCVIGWSWIDRFDYCVEKPTWPGQPWATLMPIDSTETAKIYYRDLHSELKDKFLSLLYIKQAINLLEQKKIPFIMTYMDNLLFDNQWNTSPAIEELQQQIKPFMTTFDELTFLEWSRKHQYPETQNWHPLEQAHQSAAQYIIQALDRKNIGAHCHLF